MTITMQIDFLISLPPPLTPPGSNSTVAPGVRTAGVVLSSVGLGVALLLLVIFICILGYYECDERGYISDAKEWLAEVWERRQKTKG